MFGSSSGASEILNSVNQRECLRSMCSAISMGPHGMVQPIAAAVLETFVMMNKDGAVHTSTCKLLANLIFANFEGI